jgi:predicted nucleic acid-binding protein
MIVLVDTNVLLDVIQERKPFDANATRVWKLVEDGKIDGHVSALSYNNIFYVVRKQLGAQSALDAVRLVRQAFRFVPTDEQVIDWALAAKAGDFEDAIQAAAANRAGADCIVTRNAKDFAPFGVVALTPEELLALVQP